MRTARREQVLALRLRAQQVDREHGTVADTAVLDLGVQDTGPDGAGWALAVRGVDVAAVPPDDLVTAWTLRGAPHVYRRADLPSVVAAVAPFSETDAARRVFDARRPLRAAGIPVLEALDVVAAALRDVVTGPTVKGDASGALNARLPAPYLRECRPCGTTHVHELTFRLAALRAGLELQPGTSPPVLAPVPGFRAADVPEERHDVVRGYLRLLGPATPGQVAAFLDAPVADVRARWPEDVVEVDVEGERRSLLAADADGLTADPPTATRLLGPYDLHLQARDRHLLVDDPARTRALWPVLGRPGVVLAGGEVAGLWRPRQSGQRLRLAVQAWRPLDRAGLEEQAERLAAYRGVRLAGVDLA